MISKIKIYSAVTIVALFVGGCGNTNSEAKNPLKKIEKNEKAITINDLRELSTDSGIENIQTSKLRSSALKIEEGKDGDQSGDNICKSGSMDFNTQNNHQKITFKAINCFDGYTTINGLANVEIYSNESGGKAEVLEDLSIKDNEFSLMLKKGSNINMTTNKGKTNIKTDFDLVANGKKLSVRNLFLVMKEDESGSSFYIASGEISTDEYYFKVDPSFDPSKTAIIANENGTVSGAIHLIDGAGHKIEISINTSNRIEIWVDENGDGIRSENEKMIQSID